MPFYASNSTIPARMQALRRTVPRRRTPRSPILRSGLFLAGVVAIALGALLLGSGCSDDDPAGPDYAAIDPIVFAEHVLPILQANCTATQCHNATDKASGLALESYAQLAAGSDHGAVILPFEPEWSHLYAHITGDAEPRMPKDGDPLPDDVIAFLRRWIEEGAPDDGGSAMYSTVVEKAYVACQGENVVAALDLETGLTAHYINVMAPHSVYVDRMNRRLYVSRFEDATNNVMMYDADSYQRLKTGQAGTFPALMGMPPGKDQLWVTNFSTPSTGDDKVRVLNPTTLAVEHTFGPSNMKQPHGLAFSTDGALVFVTNILSSDITIFRTANPGTGDPDILIPSVPLPDRGGIVQQPQQCVLSVDGMRLFVSALEANEVHVLDVSDLDALAAQPNDETFWKASVTVGEKPWHMTLSPDGNELWVANWTGNSVSVVDVSNPDAPVAAEPLAPHMMHEGDHEGEMIPVFQSPIGISFSPDGEQVWVANANNGNLGGHHPGAGDKPPGSVVVVDASSQTVLEFAELPHFARFVDFLP